VHELRIPHAANPGIGIVTFSAGVSTFRPDEDTDAAAVLARADAALYRAKARGRDCVEEEEGAGGRVE
jgi:PleD family two-component response regulator